MAHGADHLTIEELERGYAACATVTAARHFQAILLLAKGHTVGAVAEVTLFGTRWLEQLLERYNARGPAALGDQRAGNGAAPTILKPDLLERLRERLQTPPPDGGLWVSRKVAAWLAGELGLDTVPTQRGWEALRAIGWSIQAPRPRNPKAATAEEAAACKKTRRDRGRGGRRPPRPAGRGLRHG